MMRVLFNENDTLDTMTERLNTLLESGWVMFIYEKTDGSERNAIGTRNSDLIKEFAEKNGLAKKSIDKSEITERRDRLNGYIRYFDLSGRGTRTFYGENLTAVDIANMTDEEIDNFTKLLEYGKE